MQRTSAGFIPKTLSFSYTYPTFLRINSKMKSLNSFIMQMQHLGSRWLGYTREPLLTGFIETKVLPCASLMAKGLPWLSLRVLLLTLCPVEEADELLYCQPQQPWQELPWNLETNSEVTNLGQLVQKTSTPNTYCPFHSHLRGTMQPSWEVVHWYLDWSNNQPQISLRQARKMRWLTDGCSTQMVSLALIGCFHTKNWHNPNESSVPDVVIHLEIRKQKCRYQDSKVPNQSTWRA